MTVKKRKPATYIKAVIAVAVVLLTVWYLVYSARMISASRVSVELIQDSTVKNVVTTTAFIVRDENRSDKSGNNAMLLKSTGSGVYLPLVTDGSKVAANDAVALQFSNAENARSYSMLRDIDSQIDSYTTLQQQSVLSSFDVSTLNSHIKDGLNAYVGLIESGNLLSLTDCARTLESGLLARQSATGEVTTDFSVVLEELRAQRASLAQSEMTAARLQTSHPGYFISNVDGYEQSADYENLEDMTAMQIQQLIDSSPAPVDANVYGKIVGSFRWYALCSLPDSVLQYIRTGSSVSATFGESGDVTVQMTVSSLSESVDGYVAVVLECGKMDEAIAGLRIEKADIAIKTYEGYKIVSSALRQNDEGEIGVYIMFGNIVAFRYINVLYYSDNFVVVESYDAEADAIAKAEAKENNTVYKCPLKPYDSVIVKGRNLYDGKNVYQ